MLRGLDGPAWGALDHAYGPADDIPEVIRAAASSSADAAEAAVDELFGSIFHQGTVYSASVAAVPFIAELAVAPKVHHRSLLVYLLGAMADPAEAYGTEVAEVRAAVTAEVPRLLPLLADPDPEVRENAAYLLAHCPDMAEPVVADLRDRLAIEDVPLVRASLLAALGHLDPTGCAGLLSAAVGDSHPAVRAAAALAIASAGPAVARARNRRGNLGLPRRRPAARLGVGRERLAGPAAGAVRRRRRRAGRSARRASPCPISAGAGQSGRRRQPPEPDASFGARTAGAATDAAVGRR